MPHYLKSTIMQFEFIQNLANKTLAQLSEQEIFRQPSSANNSIAIIMNHLAGNMLSRWTNFLTTDGEKEWRNRDEEFAPPEENLELLLTKWNSGWNCMFDALSQLTSDDLSKLVYIRNQGHTVLEAIQRQLSHYSYHVGQLVYVGKLIRNDEWVCLSIPKGTSSEYNASKFDQAKHREHFTSEWRKKDQ
jgi:hypothetical protein